VRRLLFVKVWSMKIKPFTTVNGLGNITNDMGGVYRSGWTVVVMKAIGKGTRQMSKAS
jgi:hypothetical protein